MGRDCEGAPTGVPAVNIAIAAVAGRSSGGLAGGGPAGAGRIARLFAKSLEDALFAWRLQRPPPNALDFIDCAPAITLLEQAWRTGDTAGIGANGRPALLETACVLRIELQERWRAQLCLFWTPGHGGAIGNEVADVSAKAIAKRAARAPSTRARRTVAQPMALGGWATPEQGDARDATKYHLLPAEVKAPFRFYRERFSQAGTWQLLSREGAFPARGSYPIVDCEALGGAAYEGDPRDGAR